MSSGIIWCNSKTTTEQLDRKRFGNWYQDRHIPDVLKTGAVTRAERFEAIDSNEDLFHLTIYYAPVMDGLLEKMKPVSHHDSGIIPGSHDMFDYAFFDTRFYKLVQLYERPDSPTSTPDFCVSTEMSPADAEDFEHWYRVEHLTDGSRIRGWRRTERYELVNAIRAPDAPKFLTLLFLDGEAFPDLSRGVQSPWTKKILAGMTAIRSVAFKKAIDHNMSKI